MSQPLPLLRLPRRPRADASPRVADAGSLTLEPARAVTPAWVDALVLGVVLAGAYGITRAASAWTRPIAPGAVIDTSPWQLPYYAGLSTFRMAVAYVISLVFSLVYARVAVASRSAERVTLPLLDILQSVPILSFMPGVVLGLAALFPGRTTGLELAAIILIFTSQAWNLAFSFHQSLLTIPRELSEAATVYRLGFWQRFTRLELPFGAISLIANSMMSWAGGWFFLMASEQFTLGEKNFRLPGLGSYLAAAADRGDLGALLLGLLTLVAVIVLLDQLLWRPLVAWSDRFKVEQSGVDAPTSLVLELLKGSQLTAWWSRAVVQPIARWLDRALRPAAGAARRNGQNGSGTPDRGTWVGRLLLIAAGVALLALVVWGAIAAAHVLVLVTWPDWQRVLLGTAATFVRTFVALVLAALWTVPVGVWIGTNPRWARRAQPIVQIVASVPANAVFPVLLLALLALPGGSTSRRSP